MTGKIIYYICDGCKKTTLDEPDMNISNSGEHVGQDYHFCGNCDDADWFWCKRCRVAHQFECPVDAAKMDAAWREYEAAANAAQLAEVQARNDALPF